MGKDFITIGIVVKHDLANNSIGILDVGGDLLN